jgi:hypothetical protein
MARLTQKKKNIIRVNTESYDRVREMSRSSLVAPLIFSLCSRDWALWCIRPRDCNDMKHMQIRRIRVTTPGLFGVCDLRCAASLSYSHDSRCPYILYIHLTYHHAAGKSHQPITFNPNSIANPEQDTRGWKPSDPLPTPSPKRPLRRSSRPTMSLGKALARVPMSM